MNNTEFIQEVKRTGKGHKDWTKSMTVGGLGIAGEAGEVADYIKKVVFHEHDLNVIKMLTEIGDVLWYCFYLCDVLGFTIEDAMDAVTIKLQTRYPVGFTPKDSMARVDVVDQEADTQLVDTLKQRSTA